MKLVVGVMLGFIVGAVPVGIGIAAIQNAGHWTLGFVFAAVYFFWFCAMYAVALRRAERDRNL